MKKIKTVLQSKYLFFIIFLITLIYSLISTILFKYQSKYSPNTTNFYVHVIDYKIDGNLLSATVKGKEKLKLTYYLNNEEEKNFYIDNLKFGSIMKIKGTLSIPNHNTIPYTFNYQKYLYNHHIYYILKANKITLQTNNNILYKLKNYVNKRITESSNNDYLQTFILGNKNYLESNTLNNFKSNGVSHLFAISGMHLSFFALVLGTFLTWLKIKSKTKSIIIILILLFYSFMANFTPSITRSLIFFILLTINKEFKFKIKSLDLLYLTFSIMVLIDSFYIYDIGFIYSFITTYTIIYISQKLEGKNKYIQTFLISLICFFSSIPITLYNFYEINFLSIIINIILTPLISTIIYPLSLINLILPIDIILRFFLNILDFLNNFLATITIFKVIIPIHNILIILIYYFVFYLFIQSLNYKYLTYLLGILFICYMLPKLDNNTYIYYLDVGQGDSSLIVSSNKKEVMLIDTGGKVSFNTEKWQQKKEPYYITDNTITLLKALGITKINTLLLSHGDYDHMGETIHLLNNFKVDKVIFNNDSYNELEEEAIKLLNKKKIKYYQNIKQLNFNKNNFYFLNTTSYDNENDNSNVLYFKYRKYKFLFMGDASIKREEDILNKYNLKDITFLKVGHHGSNTSSSQNFINTINPKISIISVGKNNRYGHPTKEALTNLSKSKIYRTDLDGTIEVTIKTNKYFIKTYA